MKMCLPPHNAVYPFVVVLLFYASAVFAQNEGIGTFSDLVGEALENRPQPQPTPSAAELYALAAGKTAPCVVPFFSAPTVGLEYDYRHNQQKVPNGLTIDVNEVHSPFSFVLSSTSIGLDYFHVWADGSNNIGGQQSIESNGIKVAVTQKVANWLTFLLPAVYKKDDGDAIKPTGPQTFAMDTYVLNPLVVFSTQPAIVNAERESLTLSVSSGYRITATEKNDIYPASPDVNGSIGTFSLLAQADYARKEKKETKWKISGSATWNHLTNFYLSAPSPRPDDNSFALGANFTFYIGKVEVCGTVQPKGTVKIGYQYDGFNRDYYQHSVTAAGTYRFY